MEQPRHTKKTIFEWTKHCGAVSGWMEWEWNGTTMQGG